MYRNIVVAIFVLILFARCTEEVEPIAKTAIGREYLPLAVGNYWIYDVTETNLRSFVEDSVRYQVREIVDAVYTNQIGEETYSVIKSRRTNENERWQNDSIITLNKFPNYIRRTQNNYSIVSLVFPVVEGKEWNALRFNFNGNINNEPEYRYVNVNSSFTLNNATHDTTFTVVQGKPNLTVLDNRFEVYGYGKGIIYKHFQLYKNDVEPITQIPIPGKYINGKKIIMKLTQYNVKK